MKTKNYFWEDEQYRKDQYTVPEGYFAGFPDRMMERLTQEVSIEPLKKQRLIKPWMAWVSGIAAAIIIGWFGVRAYYWEPLQEVRFQENIALFVDFYGAEFHEGQLAGYMEDNKIDLKKQVSAEVNELIQMDPDLAEEYIYQSVGF